MTYAEWLNKNKPIINPIPISNFSGFSGKSGANGLKGRDGQGFIGATGLQGIRGQLGPQGLVGSTGLMGVTGFSMGSSQVSYESAIEYVWDNSNTISPVTGKMSADSNTPESVTNFYIYNVDAQGVNQTLISNNVLSNGTLLKVSNLDNSKFVFAKITGMGMIGSVLDLIVTIYGSIGSVFSNGEKVQISFFSTATKSNGTTNLIQLSDGVGGFQSDNLLHWQDDGSFVGLHSTGGFTSQTTLIGNDYTVAISDSYIIVGGTISVTVTLPLFNDNINRVITIINATPNSSVVSIVSSSTIIGPTSLTNVGSVSYISESVSTAWYAFGWTANAS